MKLLADNLWTYVHGHLPVGLLEPPTSFFKRGSWFAAAYQKRVWDGKVRFLKFDNYRKMHRFPTGLLQDVIDYLDAREYRYELADLRNVTTVAPNYRLHPDVDLTAGKYDYQGEALDAALTFGRGVIKLATGGGKTELGAAVINSVGGQWCWLTHKRNLLYQTRARLEQRLQRPIGILGDQEEQIEDITVCMVQTLSNIFKKSGREGCREWFRTLDGLLLDECHHIDSDQWYDVVQETPAVWRFGLTATPPRPDDGGMYLTAMTGPILIDVPARELIRRDVLVPPRIWFVPIDQPNLGRSKQDWRDVYRQCIVENEYRNQRIADVVRVFSLEQKSSMILVKQVKHGTAIKQVLDDRGLTSGWIFGKTSEADRQRQLEALWAGELNTIIAQAETMGEGVDIPPLRALVNATGTRGGGSAKEDEVGRVTLQFIGRGLRRMPGKTYFDYVDFSDTGYRSLRRASLDRIETLESEGYGSYIRYWTDYESEAFHRVV